MATILLIEDDTQIRAMLEETLEIEGFEVRTAENGAKGLAAFDADAIDLVITDILMPEKEGLGMITELRKISPGVPIIAISGGGPGIQAGCNLELAALFGANHTFHKPLEIDELIQTIQDTLA